ncbi:hypothetical protein IMX26_13060 [Clostridium sp. 'deep sea']|uniref:hypothetical protein n=1 Tax=Clostridium sp. 'deep sea' TaxID=2779445 RepID=UPI0018968E54|nr:hypothetical protein [Clostridium sp. 'deep sea']QOR34415.1 hypothetical protein IMX26_13060 [Clostridium sp. 'deep sea']
MTRLKAKQVFWKIVHYIEDCSDTNFKNKAEVITDKGMTTSSGGCIMFGLDDGVIRIYDNKNFPIAAFTEDSETLLVLKEIFEDIDWGVIAND